MIVLDTHIWIRWADPSASPLPPTLVERIETADGIGVSAVSCWETTLLARRGRISFNLPLDEWMCAALDESGIQVLPVSREIAILAASLPEHHRHPADRLIIATAIVTKCPLVSLDTAFPAYRELDGLLVQD